MSRTLWTWLLGAVDDTAQAAIMLVLAGVVVSLAERRKPPETETPGRLEPALETTSASVGP